MESEKKCEKCRGTGIVKEKDGTAHTCFDCLFSGRMDQHTKDMRRFKDIS